MIIGPSEPRRLQLKTIEPIKVKKKKIEGRWSISTLEGNT